MDEIDTKTKAEATRYYTSLRQRYWRFFTGGMALCVVLGTPLFVLGSRLNPLVQYLLAVPLFVGFLTCIVVSNIAWSALMRFRCPRCGKRFILSWSSSWPTGACKHCGLYLG